MDSDPKIKVPFPPQITPDEVVSKRSLEKLSSRPPNKFFIYRLAYLKEFKKEYNLEKISMTKLSQYISRSWKAEGTEVKLEYKRLANIVEDKLQFVRKINFVMISENPIPRGESSAQPQTPLPPPPPQHHQPTAYPLENFHTSNYLHHYYYL
jgi:hypothetical protein